MVRKCIVVGVCDKVEVKHSSCACCLLYTCFNTSNADIYPHYVPILYSVVEKVSLLLYISERRALHDSRHLFFSSPAVRGYYFGVLCTEPANINVRHVGIQTFHFKHDNSLAKVYQHLQGQFNCGHRRCMHSRYARLMFMGQRLQYRE